MLHWRFMLSIGLLAMFLLNVALSMAELMRTWMTRWLTLREHRASSWSTSTASHRTGGWWWRYSLYWWCFSWSSYSSSLDSLCSISQLMAHAMRRQLQCEVFFNFCSYYYTMYTFSPRMISNRSPFCGHVNWDKLLHWSVALDSLSGDVSTTCLMYYLGTKPNSNRW